MPPQAPAQKPTIYDPQSGRLVTADEARQIMQQRKVGEEIPGALSPGGPQPTSMPFTTPPDPRIEFNQPERGDIINALPEIAALGASFLAPEALIPAATVRSAPFLAPAISRMFMTGAAAGLGEGAREMAQGEDLDLGAMTTRGVENAIPSAIGDVGVAAARGGTNLVRSAIASGRSTTTGRAVTGPIGNRAAPATASAVRAAREPLTKRTLDELATTAQKYGASLSEAGIAKLNQRAVALENKILSVTDPRLQATMRKELDQLDALIPELQEVIDQQARGGLGTARFAAGSGATRGVAAAGLTAGGAMVGGLDPATAGLLATLVGVPIGAAESSPAFRMAAGQVLAQADKLGVGAETIVRLLMAQARGEEPVSVPTRSGR